MRVLAVETSTLWGGVAVMDGKGLIAEVRLNVRTTHSERLMNAIDYSLRQSAMNISDIDVLAVAAGPGSFTGLRVGVSTVKGISYATGKPVVSVPSLEAFAWNFPFGRHPVCVMFDARKKEVYAALFLWDGENCKRLISEASVKPEELLRGHILDMDYDKVVFAGEGADLYKDWIMDIMKEKAVFAPLHLMSPSAANVAYVGLRKAQRGEFTDPKALCPFYIRKSEAELKVK